MNRKKRVYLMDDYDDSYQIEMANIMITSVLHYYVFSAYLLYCGERDKRFWGWELVIGDIHPSCVDRDDKNQTINALNGLCFRIRSGLGE